MKTKTIKIKLRPDRKTGEYYAEMITDVSLFTVKNTFDALTSHSGKIIKEKVKHTKGYCIKKGVKSVFNGVACLVSSVADGVKHSKKSYKEKVNKWEANYDKTVS